MSVAWTGSLYLAPMKLLNAHEIDFKIIGEEMQCVEIELDPHESVVAEAGSFMSMEEGINMETIFGDGSSNSGSFLDKMFNAGKRILTGESLFMTAFTNTNSSMNYNIKSAITQD